MPDPFTPKFVDLVRNFTQTTGTGNIVLGTAVSGHASLAAAVAVGERFFYCILGIDKPAEREVGRGTLTANGTISREPISGSPTNFSSGTKTIALVAAAEWFRTLGQMVNGGSDSLSALATTDKTSLMAAVNEVSAAAAAAAALAGAGASDVLFVAAGGTVVPAIKKTVVTAGYALASDGGATYIFDAAVNAAFVSANPRTAFLAADGRGFKLDPRQRLTIEMFGGGTGKTGAENYAAIMAALGYEPDPARNYSSPVHFGIGKYSVSQTVEVHTSCHFKGVTNGHNGGPVTGGFATILEWPTNTMCVRVHNSNTILDTAQAVNKQTSGSGSIFEGITFQQLSEGADLTAHGFRMRGAATLRDCGFQNIAGNAIHIQASATYGGALEGDVNNWRVLYCFVHSCGGNALHVEGQDSNAGLSVHLITAGQGVKGCGIFDRSVLGCTHVAPQITGYGNGGVFHLGSFYQLNESIADIGGATTPGTNSLIWYPLRTAAAPTTPFPQWVSGGTYRQKIPLFIMGPSIVVGGYQEFGQVLAHAPGAALFGAPFAFTNSSNAIKVAPLALGLASGNGVGAYRGSGGATNTPEYADEGAHSFTMLGTKDPIGGRLARPVILEHQTEQDGTFSMLWHWSAKDQYLRYFNQKPIWSIGGPGTARTYGRDSAQPYYFTLHDFALQDPGNSNNLRILGIRAAAPTTGHHAVGEFFFNIAPTATGTLGWSCTTAGTPGTWTAVPMAGFGGTYTADSTFGNVTLGLGVDGKKLRVENSTGYGLQAWMNSTTSDLYLDNSKPAVGYANMFLRANNMQFWGGSATTPVQTLTIGPTGVDIVGKMAATGAVTSNSPTAGVGYRTGSGGAVTQATSKSTGVTLNTACGAITLNAASMAADGVASFTLTNSAIAATDVVSVCIKSAATAAAYAVMVDAVAAGSCRVSLRNLTAGALAEALVLNFAVIKAVAA